MAAIAHDPAFDLLLSGAVHVQDKAAVGLLFDALAGVPLAFADPAGLVGVEADDDVVDFSVLGEEATAQVGLWVEVGVAFEGGLEDMPPADAANVEVAHLFSPMVVGQEIPVATGVIEVVGVDGALAFGAAAGGVVGDEHLLPLADGFLQVEHELIVEVDGGAGADGEMLAGLGEIEADAVGKIAAELVQGGAQGDFKWGAQVLIGEELAEEEGKEIAFTGEDGGEDVGLVGVVPAAGVFVKGERGVQLVDQVVAVAVDGALGDLEIGSQRGGGGVAALADALIDAHDAHQACGHGVHLLTLDVRRSLMGGGGRVGMQPSPSRWLCRLRRAAFVSCSSV
jgi:hypothetical protein